MNTYQSHSGGHGIAAIRPCDSNALPRAPKFRHIELILLMFKHLQAARSGFPYERSTRDRKNER